MSKWPTWWYPKSNLVDQVQGCDKAQPYSSSKAVPLIGQKQAFMIIVVLLTMEQQRIALLSNTAHKTKATTNHLICSKQEIANLVRLMYCKGVDILPSNFSPHNNLRSSVQYHNNFTGKYTSPSPN